MTTGIEANYEIRSTHAVRGMEARTVKKWEDDGWELVSRSPGRLRTEITFRRPKPKSRRLLWIIGGGVFVALLATVITIGVISERNAAPGSPASAATPTTQPDKASSPTPTPSPTDEASCEMLGASADCTFGQTVVYADATREGEVALEITVLDPVEFTPSSGARFWNSRATQMPGLPVSIYFPVTVKNVSGQDREGSFIFTQATNVDEGETEVLSVSDGDVNSGVNFDILAPGESYTFNDGWSMSSLDGLEYEISIDGLAGSTVTFTK